MCNEKVGPRPPIVPRKPNFATAELAADGPFFPEWQGDGNGNLSLREAAELAASDLEPNEIVRLGGGDPVGYKGDDGEVHLFSDEW